MSFKNINLNLSRINGGAVQEKFDYEMQQVIKNILDPNTDTEKKRQVTLTFDIVSDSDQELLIIACSSKCKLQPRESVSTKVLFGRNEDTGSIEANELKSGAPGQTFLDVEDDFKQKNDIGEEIQDEQTVINFKKG